MAEETVIVWRVLYQEGGDQVRYFDTEDAANRHGKWLANWHVGCKPLVCAMRVWPDEESV